MRDGACYARSIIYFRPDIGARLALSMFDDVIVFRALQRQFGLVIDDVRIEVRTLRAGAEDARDLRLRRGDPLVETLLAYRNGTDHPFEIALTRRSARDFRLSYSLRPAPPPT
jgi:DNA-binding GntR family transcriptional regulator